MSSERLIVGAMSGTSGDGVDAALVQIGGAGLEMTAKHISHQHLPFDSSVKSLLFAMRESGTCRLSDLAKLGREISLVYVATVRKLLEKTDTRAQALQCVAAHGQTLFHDPPNTIQYFDPSLVAYELGCPVVSDFRRADLAAGGQGAPLVPFADYILFRHPEKNRVLLNIGGIANITWLKAGGTLAEVIAFDTGPGNCVVDHLARSAGIPEGIDRDGARCRRGNASFPFAFGAIRNWKDVFRPPPKSADTPEMIAAFEKMRHPAIDVTGDDAFATASLMTAMGVGLAIERLPAKPDELFVSGGGVNNPRILSEIEAVTRLLPRRCEELAIPSDAKEAIAFAILGAATMDGFPSNVPSVTGASRSVVLGSITPRP